MDLTADHVATVSKDRTGLFDGQYFIPTVDTGKQLAEWLESGEKIITPDMVIKAQTKWIELGLDADRIDAQTKKLYGSPLNNITEKQGQEFIDTLNESIKAKKEKESEEQKGA
ncbi:hypothetical protein D3C77_585310 [compost metagenome]